MIVAQSLHTPREVLENTKELLLEDGWTPFSTPSYHEYDWDHVPKHKRDPGQPWFLSQAISYISGSESSPLRYRTSSLLCGMIGSNLIRWELQDGRTQQEVIDLLDRTIDSLC